MRNVLSSAIWLYGKLAKTTTESKGMDEINQVGERWWTVFNSVVDSIDKNHILHYLAKRRCNK